MIYFYLLIPLLFVSADSSSIRGRNNKNDLVPFTSSRSDPEKRGSSMKTVSSEPLFMKFHLPNSGDVEARGKDKKRKQPLKKRISKIKPLRKRQRTRRELQKSKLKSIREVQPNPPEFPHAVNATEVLKNITNAINRVDILKALSTYSKKGENKRINADDQRKGADATKSSRNHHNRHFPEQPRLKLVYPSTPKTDRHPHKYTYKDLVTDRERLEQKIKYIKSMLSINDSAVDDTVRVRRRSDSDRAANKVAKLFLTLSAVNGLNDRRKSKCEEDDDRVQDVWEKERRESPSRKASSSNEERYKVKKWIEFMKTKRSSGKTCPCMAMNGEDRDVFPLEQRLPKDYFLREGGESSEDSSEFSREPLHSSRDKPNREYSSYRRYNTNQEDQDSKVKGAQKNGKKKPEATFSDLEIYRSRAKQILQNAEEILDRIKEEEEKRLAAPNLFMNQLKELTSRIQGDPRNNENDLIRKLQKSFGWGPLAKTEENADGNQFMENVKSFILDPYEKAKALTDESTRKLSSYLLRNLGKIQEASEEQVEAEDEAGKANFQVFFGKVPTKEDEKPLPDSLAKEKSADPEKSDTDREESLKQKMEDIFKEQQKILHEYEVAQDSGEKGKETDVVGDGETETVRETQQSNLEDTVAMKLNEPDTDRNPESREKAIKSADELEKARADFVEERQFLQPEGNSWGKEGDIKGKAPGSMPTEEKQEEEFFEKLVKTTNDDTDQERVEKQRSDDEENSRDEIGEELTQSKASVIPKEQDEVQEVVASSHMTSEDISERDENDVLSSPHLKHDYDNTRENAESVKSQLETDYDPSLTQKETPTGSNQNANAEVPAETKSNDESNLENQEIVEAERKESAFSQFEEPSNPESEDIVNLKEPEFDGKKESPNDEKQENFQMEDETKKPLEYEDLVKEVGQASKESFNTDRASDSSEKSNEELKQTLKMEDSDNQSTGERTDRANKDGQTLLKLAAEMEDPENEEETDREDTDDGQLRLNLYSKDSETEKAAQNNQEEQSFESEEIQSREENLQTPKAVSSEETLKEIFESGIRNEEEDGDATLRATAEETDNQEFVKNADEDSSEETVLKEVKETQNSDETTATQDETDLREANADEDDDEKVKATEGGDDETFKAEDMKDTILESQNKEENSENVEEIGGKATPEVEEETLKSVNVLDSNLGNEEKQESSQEIVESEQPEENLKLAKSIDDEYNSELASLVKEQENLQSEALFKANEPTENTNEQAEGEDIDNESILRAENSDLPTEKETGEEIQPSSSQENVEETLQQQANSEESPREVQDSNETIKTSLEDETQDIEGEETLKEANPGDDNLKLAQQNPNEDNIETVKEVFSDEDNEDPETVKAVLENETQESFEDETLKAEHPAEGKNLEENNEDDDKIVKAVLDEADLENVRENEENLKEAKPDENLETEIVEAKEELGEKFLDKEKSDELQENEEIQTEENPLRAVLNSENLPEDEALEAEDPSVEQTEPDIESLRRTGTDELFNIDDESPLRSGNPMDLGEPEFSVNEESLREDTDNEIDEGETLRSGNDAGNRFYEGGYETLLEDLVENPVQKSEELISDLLQMPEPTPKSLKGAGLKVPKSIGKIMNDLEGSEKDDIASIQNLNPDKIDHIIGKIDQAEQKNLLESQEVDCKKECACAEDMSTRSRNSGRYEIVKDFLHWMKDLQLNRVLSDD